MAADRHPRAQARRLCAPLRLSCRCPSAEDRSALAPALGGLERPLRHGPRTCQRQSHAIGRPRASSAGRSSLDLASAAKDHPEILERYFLTEAVSPNTADASRRSMRPSGPAGRCSTCPRGSRSRPRCSAWSAWPMAGASTSTICWSCSKKAPRPRSSARPPASAGARPGPPCRGGRAVRRAGGQAPVRQRPELGRLDLALQPGAGPGRSGRLDPVDRRRPGLPARQGQPGSRADGAGGRGPGQRRDVHHRQAAPRLLHPAGPRRAPGPGATLLYKAGSRTARGSSGRA